ACGFPVRWKLIAGGRASSPASGPNARRYFGIQAFFENVRDISDQVELDLIPGGYVGLTRQEGGRFNLCALLDPSWIGRCGPHLDNVLKALMQKNPVLKSHLQAARRLSGWQAVGPVTMGLRRLAEENIFYLGDAACVVDPFVGE